MLIYFSTRLMAFGQQGCPQRSKARTFANGQKKVIDKGLTSPKRWGVKII